MALEWIIERLTSVKKKTWGTECNLEAKAIRFIIYQAAEAFAQDDMLVELSAPVKVFGDVHGQFFDLFRLFEIAGWPNKDKQFLFIGDYIDRGK
jgi:serine/threonine-protein phosphatase PP1 catalytic subunit